MLLSAILLLDCATEASQDIFATTDHVTTTALICHSGTAVCSCVSVSASALCNSAPASSRTPSSGADEVARKLKDDRLRNAQCQPHCDASKGSRTVVPSSSGVPCDSELTDSPCAGLPISQATIPVSSERSCTALLQTSVQFRQTLSFASCGRPGCSACDVAVSSDQLASLLHL